jgi:hypothetical protein
MKNNLILGQRLAKTDTKKIKGGGFCIQAMCFLPDGNNELITSYACGMVARICFNLDPAAELGNCQRC